VLELLAEGASNKLIARRLDISPNTVKSHAARLFEKLEAQSRTQAVHKARELDLLP
jgi:ATP/maltotriose-dependent transcriptional regulator MalT